MIEEHSTDGTGWAAFSHDRFHRYRLARALTPKAIGPNGMLIVRPEFTDDGRLVQRIVKVTFVMLNPSTADAFKLDPTVKRCVKFAQRWGADILEVVNLFAFRTPYPAELKRSLDRGDGPDNDAQILAACQGATKVIAAWGSHGVLLGRAAHVTTMLEAHGVEPHALALSNWIPRHPLARGKHRIPDDAQPVRWP